LSIQRFPEPQVTFSPPPPEVWYQSTRIHVRYIPCLFHLSCFVPICVCIYVYKGRY
jgi:hypothetical protein